MLYTNNPFDRADQIRKDSEQIDTLWSLATTRVLPSHQGKFWIDTQNLSDGSSVVTFESVHHSGDNEHRIFLGFFNDIAWFALDYSTHAGLDSLPLAEQAQLLDLRAAGPLLAAQDGSMLAYAQAVLHWHRQSLYCQLCGHPNRISHAGHVKVCTNGGCGHETFPRTDAAVIMLITEHSQPGPARCLLGRSPKWPNGVYSTLAGFVEPGETLEDAVRREVFEEAGVQVGQVEYLASQPWPFPQSMMLGFHGIATSTDINIDYDELADAAWFTREQLAAFGDWGDERFELQLPRPDSISRYLIDTWINQPDQGLSLFQGRTE